MALTPFFLRLSRACWLPLFRVSSRVGNGFVTPLPVPHRDRARGYEAERATIRIARMVRQLLNAALVRIRAEWLSGLSYRQDCLTDSRELTAQS
jgi:hypothetical protein